MSDRTIHDELEASKTQVVCASLLACAGVITITLLRIFLVETMYEEAYISLKGMIPKSSSFRIQDRNVLVHVAEACCFFAWSSAFVGCAVGGAVRKHRLASIAGSFGQAVCASSLACVAICNVVFLGLEVWRGAKLVPEELDKIITDECLIPFSISHRHNDLCNDLEQCRRDHPDNQICLADVVGLTSATNCFLMLSFGMLLVVCCQAAGSVFGQRFSGQLSAVPSIGAPRFSMGTETQQPDQGGYGACEPGERLSQGSLEPPFPEQPLDNVT